MSIGKKLQELLRIQEIPEIDLAKHLGISPVRLSNYLSDKNEPDIAMLEKAAKYLSVSLNYFTYPLDMQEEHCQSITLGYVEDVHISLNNHQRLVDYLIYEIAELNAGTLSNAGIYAYMLELSNAHVEEICKEIEECILKERKRILGVGS